MAVTDPNFSSVKCDMADFGRHSGTIVLLWLETDERPPEADFTDVELVARQSSLGC